MTKISLRQLIWDEWNLEHIKKHNLTKKEIEIAINNLKTNKVGYNRRLILIGRSGKRLVSIILAKKSKVTYYLVTARDADKKERRLVYEKEK